MYLHWTHFDCLCRHFYPPPHIFTSDVRPSICSLCVFRLAELTNDREGGERVKKAKPVEMVQTSLADRFTQLQDAENAWKKKVRLSAAESLGRRKKTPKVLCGSLNVSWGAGVGRLD